MKLQLFQRYMTYAHIHAHIHTHTHVCAVKKRTKNYASITVILSKLWNCDFFLNFSIFSKLSKNKYVTFLQWGNDIILLDKIQCGCSKE